MEFRSRRSVVHSTKGMAASTQPLASAAAVKLLEQGCNAVEAAIGCSAVLAVVEPSMTSLGDAFILHFNGKTKKVEGLNGSGKSSHNINLENVRKTVGLDCEILPFDSAFSVNVPGTAAAWVDAVEKWGTGRKTLREILEPAIELARNGFPVSEISSAIWRASEDKLKGSELLIDGKRAPNEGELFINEPLARVLERIADHGKEGFYTGPTADAIIDTVAKNGGVLDHTDLKNHQSLFLDPISVPILGTPYRLWELPPNNHGIVALLALNFMRQAIKQHYSTIKLKHNSPEYIHLLTECLKFAFKEAEHWVADPEQYSFSDSLLTEEYASIQVQKLYNPKKANQEYERGDEVISHHMKSDTSYYCVTDSEGNGCSMISSLYKNFGSGIVPKNTGFALHNRGCNFSLNPNSRNVLGPSKRSYHTIIPALLTEGMDKFYGVYGVMGGFMQPQGHVQVALNLILFNMDPQKALDAPRVCLRPPNCSGREIPVAVTKDSQKYGVVVNLEKGFDPSVAAELENYGHNVRIASSMEHAFFGRGQIILEDVQNSIRVYHAGSDPRGDGCAIPQV